MLTGPPPKFHGTRDILLFDMYAGPWSAWFAYDRVIGLLLVYAGLMLAAPVTSYGRCARPARCSTWYCCRRRQPSGSVSLSPFPGCSRSRESRWWPRGGRSSPGRAIGPLLRRQDGVVHRNEPRVDSPLEWAETRSVKSTRTLRARVARTSRLSGSPSGRTVGRRRRRGQVTGRKRTCRLSGTTPTSTGCRSPTRRLAGLHTMMQDAAATNHVERSPKCSNHQRAGSDRLAARSVTDTRGAALRRGRHGQIPRRSTDAERNARAGQGELQTDGTMAVEFVQVGGKTSQRLRGQQLRLDRARHSGGQQRSALCCSSS